MKFTMSVFLLWAGRIVLGVFVLFILLGVGAFIFRSNVAPAVDNAPYAVQTYSNDADRIPSRIYYGEEFTYNDGIPTLTGTWWSYDGKKYHRHDGEKEFPADDYGQIDIIRRN